MNWNWKEQIETVIGELKNGDKAALIKFGAIGHNPIDGTNYWHDPAIVYFVGFFIGNYMRLEQDYSTFEEAKKAAEAFVTQ